MKLKFIPLFTLCAAPLGACAVDANAEQDAWREAIVHSPITEAGCFHASYPNMTWDAVACTNAPGRLFAHPAPSPSGVFVVGNGADYQLTTTSPISAALGSFPRVSGLVSENDSGTPNSYSIQLNSNFMSGTAACGGVSGCMSWAQFVYSSSEQSAFIQSWLINYGNTCPTTGGGATGWMNFSGSCYSNSTAASVPTLPLSTDAELSALKIAGKAVNGGNDTVVFANGTEAFTASEPDSTTNLASAWSGAEFNIIGDGGGTEALFNRSTAMKVRIGVRDGSTAAPSCTANDGTTGETNNRVLGPCTAKGGAEPSVEFSQAGS
jgi:hypothetical protein